MSLHTHDQSIGKWQPATVVMDPLQAVEDILGNVETWPTYAIYNIFDEEPCPKSIKKVAAFMYGNRVPLDIAEECFKACCG